MSEFDEENFDPDGYTNDSSYEIEDTELVSELLSELREDELYRYHCLFLQWLNGKDLNENEWELIKTYMGTPDFDDMWEYVYEPEYYDFVMSKNALRDQLFAENSQMGSEIEQQDMKQYQCTFEDWLKDRDIGITDEGLMQLGISIFDEPIWNKLFYPDFQRKRSARGRTTSLKNGGESHDA